MTTDEYVPSEKAVRHAYVVIENRRDILAARAEFDRFLARVRRDAARSGYRRGYSDRASEHDYDHAYPEEIS